MTIKPDNIYWDSCVFIDALQHTAGRYDILREIVESAKRGETRIVTSAFSIAEVISLSSDRPVSAADAKKIKEFFENDYIKLRNVDRPTIELAADIGRQNIIKPPDALHIATAIRAKCRELQTYDGVNDPTNKKRLLFYDGKIGVPALAIKVPSLPRAVEAQKHLSFDGSDARPAASLHLNGRLPIHPLRRLVPLAACMLRVG